MVNLIRNSIFQDSNSDGTPDLFTKIGSGGTLAIISGLLSSQVGNALDSLINDTGGTGLYQNVLLEQNENYTLSFMAMGGGSDVTVKVQEITSALAATGNVLVNKTLRAGLLGRESITFNFSNSEMAGVKVSIYGKTVGVSDTFKLAYMQLEKGLAATDYSPSIYELSDMFSKANENLIAKVATVTGINAKTVAVTTLYTVPAGKTFIPAFVVIRCTAFTAGAKSVQAVASFGGNSATYDDFLNTQTYTVAVADVFIKDGVEDSALAVQAAGDVFKIAIETGSNATTETWSIDLFGYLI